MATKKTTKTVASKVKKQVENLSSQQKMGIGIGLTATAVAAAGAYFLYGSSDAKKNRTKVKGWMLRAKGEVLETLEKAEEMTEAEYDKLIDSVSGAYSRLKDASKVDIATFKREMKEHWSGIEKMAKPAKKKVTKASKKTATKTKKTVKKVAKKAKKEVKKRA